MQFGIIAEGVTDQEVITNILRGFFGDKALPVTALQPKPNEPGNWDKVFKYCASPELKQALAFNEYVVIHIDTDVLQTENVPAEHMLDHRLSVQEKVDVITSRLIALIGVDFYDTFRGNFIFAIAVEQTECWLLPIYYTNNKTKAGKTTGCLAALNDGLKGQETFYIDGKNVDHYRKMAAHFLKKADLLRFAGKNESLGIFIGNLGALQTLT